MESVKRTASRGETGMVGVQGCAEAEASSHQTRKRCRKTKVVEGSSDQPQEGGQEVEIIEGSSDQPKEGGSMTKKQQRDYKRYHNMKDGAQKYKEMGPQMEILKNDTAELRVEVGKISSERLPAITEHLAMVAEQLKIVMNDYKKMGTLTEGFVQSELKKNDWDIPLDYDYLDGKENLLTVSECPLEMFDLVGMPREEILPELQKIKDSFEEFKRESDRRYEEFKRESDRRYEELKSENEELKRENKRLNSRITTIETLKNK